MTKHEKFLQELRAPVLRAEKAQRSARAKTKTSSRTVPGQTQNRDYRAQLNTHDELMAELEAKFNELFGTATEEDD